MKSEKHAKIKRWAIVSYVVVLNIALVLSMFGYFSTKGVVTREQVKNLALGYALKECLDLEDKDVNCKSIKVGEPEGSCFEWYCNDPPLWGITYHTTSGKKITGQFYINITGGYVSVEEMTRSYT